MPKRSKEQWLQLFEQQAQSGLSSNRFCKEQGLCPKYFSLRRKQLLSGARQEKLGAQNAFVKASRQSPVPETIPTLVIQHGRSQIILPSNIDTCWLASLLLALS